MEGTSNQAFLEFLLAFKKDDPSFTKLEKGLYNIENGQYISGILFEINKEIFDENEADVKTIAQ